MDQTVSGSSELVGNRAAKNLAREESASSQVCLDSRAKPSTYRRRASQWLPPKLPSLGDFLVSENYKSLRGFSQALNLGKLPYSVSGDADSLTQANFLHWTVPSEVEYVKSCDYC